MRQPFTRKPNEYEQALADYGRVIAPDVLDDILERSLEQYPETPISFGLLVDLKVLRHIMDDMERFEDER